MCDVSPTCVRRRRARRVLPDDVVGGQRPTEETEYFRSGHSHAESWSSVSALIVAAASSRRCRTASSFPRVVLWIRISGSPPLRSRFDRRGPPRRGSTEERDRSLRSTERDRSTRGDNRPPPWREENARHEIRERRELGRETRRLASSLRAGRKRERKATGERDPERGWTFGYSERERGRETETESGTLARVAGRRVTESGSRAFRRYIKTVPCVAAVVA